MPDSPLAIPTGIPSCPDGQHDFAPTFQWSRFGGSYHRPCLNDGCSFITLDPVDDLDDVCDECANGQHDTCLDPIDCMCIDMEHDGGRYGETDSHNDRYLIP